MAIINDSNPNVNVEVLVEEAKALGINAKNTWKPETIQKKIAEAKGESTPTPSNTTIPVVSTSQASEADLSAIFDRLDKLEKENAELKGESPKKNGKERYKGPRLYSYKMWGGIPVLNYVSKKKDPKRGLVYRNANDVYINNQNLELALADDTTEEVDVNDFGNSFERSDKMEAVDENGNTIMLGMTPQSYTFKNIEGYGDITVLPNSIN